MAKITSIDLPTPPTEFENLDSVLTYLQTLSKVSSDSLNQITQEVNGKIELTNLYVSEVSITNTGSANTDFTVTHNLGRTPKFYIPRVTTNLSAIGSVSFYDGSVAWNSISITLKCTVANIVVNFLVLA
jgi:hypothetical protein